MADTSTVTIHMVSSLDGFIAKNDGSVLWLQSTDTYEQGVVLTDEAVAAFLKNIDCYVMGSRTYEHALELGWPYGDVPVIVLTNRDLKTARKNVAFYAGDLEQLLNNRLKPNFKEIWVVGGAMLAKDLSGLTWRITSSYLSCRLFWAAEHCSSTTSARNNCYTSKM